MATRDSPESLTAKTSVNVPPVSQPTIHISGQGEGDAAVGNRANLTIRMTIRRLTRLTNAFSKKWENHEAALGLFFAYYNFCRAHQTLSENNGLRWTPFFGQKKAVP